LLAGVAAPAPGQAPGATAKPQGPPPQQDPQPKDPQQQDPQQQDPRPQDPRPQDPARPGGQPIDETRTAADILKKMLGLDAGPGELPAFPPPPPLIWQSPATDGRPKPQDPKPGPPPTELPSAARTPAFDPTAAAARAMERLMPDAVPPPIPDPATGVVPALPAPADVAPRDAQPEFLTGSLRLRYRARHGGDDDDQDVVGLLSVRIGDADRDPVSGTLLARGFADLDGRNGGVFQGLDHSFGDRAEGRVLLGHIDVHRVVGLRVARLGRQDLVETPVALTLDGLRVESDRADGTGLWWGAYGGVPVHHFESSSRGDLAVGVSGGLRPWRGARVRVDGMHLDDDQLGTPGRRDLLLGTSWWQSLGDVARLRGEHTWLDGNPRDLVLAVDGSAAEESWLGALDGSVTYRELLTTQRAQVTELDPYFEIASDFKPYRQLTAQVSRGFGEHFVLAGGADVRRLRNARDEGAFNREFTRGYLEPSLDGLFGGHLDASIVLERWETDGEDLDTVGGELRFALDRELSLRLSSFYELYSLDTIQGRERDHVRTWELRAEYRPPSGDFVFDAGYALERDDFDTYHTFRMAVSWMF